MGLRYTCRQKMPNFWAFVITRLIYFLDRGIIGCPPKLMIITGGFGT